MKHLLEPLILIVALIVFASSCTTPLLIDDGAEAMPPNEEPIGPGESTGDSQAGAEPVTLPLEAESASITSAFAIGNDAYASAGSYIAQPSNAENAAMRTASIAFTVPASDDYVVWIRMYGPSLSEDAAYVGIGDDLRRVYPSTPGTYEWVRVGVWPLEAGLHAIGLGPGEANARLDLVTVTNAELSVIELDALADIQEGLAPPPSVPPSNPNEGSNADREPFSLRGDPEFSEEQLSSQGRVWHSRLIAGFASQDHDYTTKYAQSGNLYNLGRGLHTHIQSLLWAFRATGDLRILDEVDRLAQIMRSSLDDSWCAPEPDPRYGYVGEDGFVNWRWLSSGSEIHYCRDVHRLDESKTHGLVATVAYAYEMNRDLDSPSGVDYAERADFWSDYLFNEYEKKWQARKPNGRIDDALTRVEGYDSGHAQMSNIKMHYYLYRLSGDSKYLDRAEGMSDQVFAGLRRTPTSNGDAYVWSRRWIAEEGDATMYLQPSTYARYVFADFAELHVEGVGEWADPVHMPRFANTLVQLMMDDGSNSLARDVGGGIARAGIPASPEEDWNRADENRFAASPYTMIIPWDTTGKGAEVAEGFYVNREGSRVESPRYLQVPAAMVFYSEWQR